MDHSGESRLSTKIGRLRITLWTAPGRRFVVACDYENDVVKQKDSLGRWGEDLATAYLRDLGWTILDRNWRCRAGEIDIVAVDPGEPARLVAVEVKTKAGVRFGDPLEAVTFAKTARLGRLALWWQRSHPDVPFSLRLDAVGVTKMPGLVPVVRHVRGLS